jgi:hypothetical protein
MLIKSKNPVTLDVPVATVSMEDIDHVMHAYELEGVVTSVESLHDEIVHAGDIVSSIENLSLVLEGIQEYSMTTAALVQVVGDVAGASCGVEGSHFTPSMEAEEEGVPLGQKIKAILNQIAAWLRKIYAQIKMYIAHQFSKSHRIAKSYESLGEKIKAYDFTRAEEIEMRDLPGAKGGLVGLARALAPFSETIGRSVNGGMMVLKSQFDLLETVRHNFDLYPRGHGLVVQATDAAAQGLTSMDTEAASMAVSPTILGGGHLEVIRASAHQSTTSPESFKQAFAASVRINQNRIDAQQPGMTKIKPSHQILKDIFDAMRADMDALCNPTGTYARGLKDVDERCMAADKELHEMLKKAESMLDVDDEMIAFFRTAAVGISHGQIKDLIHAHHYFQRVMQVVISYLNSCMDKAAPKVEPTKPAQPGHQAAAAAV